MVDVDSLVLEFYTKASVVVANNTDVEDIGDEFWPCKKSMIEICKKKMVKEKVSEHTSAVQILEGKEISPIF